MTLMMMISRNDGTLHKQSVKTRVVSSCGVISGRHVAAKQLSMNILTYPSSTLNRQEKGILFN